MNIQQNPIPAYIINLKKREDRRKHILEQFADKPEFVPVIVPAHEHERGARGLWQTILEILAERADAQSEYVLICEDDHIFTEHYSSAILQKCIAQAMEKQADILIGGPSWFENAISRTEHLYWVEKFTGFQFVLIFRKFIPQLLNADFTDHDVADLFISRITEAKFFITPLISIQQSFGYSDVTAKNDIPGRVDELYVNCVEKVKLLETVDQYYRTSVIAQDAADDLDLDAVCMPVYVMLSPDIPSNEGHIRKEFQGRREFEVSYMNVASETTESQWETLCKIVKMAIDKEEDVIIICNDDHRFTSAYERGGFIREVIQAFKYGVRIMCGSISNFSQIVPVSEGCYWVDQVTGTQFMVIYHPAFSEILQEKPRQDDTMNRWLSEIITNKTVIYPFISGPPETEASSGEVKFAEKAMARYELCNTRLEKVTRALKVY